jgi:thiamine kinase-like enzyme
MKLKAYGIPVPSYPVLIPLFSTIIIKSTSQVVFCHNDLQEGNILLPKASSGNIRMPSVSEDASPQPRNSLSAFNPTDPRLVLIDFEVSYLMRL